MAPGQSTSFTSRSFTIKPGGRSRVATSTREVGVAACAATRDASMRYRIRVAAAETINANARTPIILLLIFYPYELETWLAEASLEFTIVHRPLVVDPMPMYTAAPTSAIK